MADDSTGAVAANETGGGWSNPLIERAHAAILANEKARKEFRSQFWEALQPLVNASADVQADYQAIRNFFDSRKELCDHLEKTEIDDPINRPEYKDYKRNALHWYQDFFANGSVASAEQLSQLKDESFSNSIRDVLGYRYFFKLVDVLNDFVSNSVFEKTLIETLEQSGKISPEEIKEVHGLINKLELDSYALKGLAYDFTEAYRKGLNDFEAEKHKDF